MRLVESLNPPSCRPRDRAQATSRLGVAQRCSPALSDHHTRTPQPGTEPTEQPSAEPGISVAQAVSPYTASSTMLRVPVGSLLVVVAVSLAGAFPNGAPPEACIRGMTPNHGGAVSLDPQTLPFLVLRETFPGGIKGEAPGHSSLISRQLYKLVAANVFKDWENVGLGPFLCAGLDLIS